MDSYLFIIPICMSLQNIDEIFLLVNVAPESHSLQQPESIPGDMLTRLTSLLTIIEADDFVDYYIIIIIHN
jgi:hypothetical protein